MKHDSMDSDALNYQLCRYGTSKHLFRGPRKKLVSPYVAVLGGTETFGKFVAHPFPDLLQLELGMPVANFGCQNAGVDAFLHDHGLLTLANRAKVTVLQIPGAQNMSNRFYSVHPRRNDRFLRGSSRLKDLYGDVDLSEISFTHHLLTTLHAASPDRFDQIIDELRTAWVARMKLLIALLDCQVVLLWLADHPIAAGEQNGIDGSDPMFVDQAMIKALTPFVSEIVEVTVSRDEVEEGRMGLIFSGAEHLAMQGALGTVAHRKASRALRKAIARLD